MKIAVTADLHWGIRPDLVIAAKGATSGYVPFGFVAASGAVYEAVREAGPFVHGFTYSHSPVGAAAATEVLRILEAEDLIAASAAKGERLKSLLAARLGRHANVGEIRGRGLLLGLELVADRESRAPFPRSARLVEAVARECRDRELLVYTGTGNANGIDGDVVVLGPPFVITDAELELVAERLGEAVESATSRV